MIIFCKPCGLKIECDKRFSIMKYISIHKHIRSTKRNSNKNELPQRLLTLLPATKILTMTFILSIIIIS